MNTIMGKNVATLNQMKSYIKKVNPNIPSSVLDMLKYYLSEGEIEGVRGDIAFCQSCLETGNFTFKGSAVTLDQNNFAGIGVTSNGMKGNSWETPQLGIRAQIQHLKAYGSTEPLVQECVDPRFKYVSRGCAIYVEWLGIQENPDHKGWASGANYGNKILSILNNVLSIKDNNSNNNQNEGSVKTMKFNIHAGHNFKVPGAGGCFSETSEDRKVKDLVISKLRSLGHTVYDCTDEDGTTSGANLANIVNKCNAHKVDLDVSIHFNAFNGSAHGTEVFQYDSKTNSYASGVVNAIASLGFTNRGVKNGSHLYVIRNTISPAILIECCFCDCMTDANIYNAEKMATAIVKGLTGQTVNSGSSNSGGSGSTGGGSSSSGEMYRIRKSWSDSKSQVGAYRNLESAKKACPVGYSVYNNAGKEVYSNKPSSGGSGSSGSGTVYRVTADVLNVRTGPGTSYGVATQVKKGQAYTIVEIKNGWGKLKSGAGWVSMDYMQSTGGSGSTTTSKFPYTVKIKADVLNVRKGAGTNYGVATQVKEGEVYTIIDESNGWGKLKSGAGWISLEYTKKV